MAAAGLLRTSFARPAGLRRAGRAPKAYAPAGLDVHVSIPHREHAVLAGILVDTVAATSDPAASQAALRVAGDRGRELGQAERAATRPGRLGAERALTLASGFLERSGFEPVRPGPALLRLRNCPFQPLAAQAPPWYAASTRPFSPDSWPGWAPRRPPQCLTPAPGPA